MFIYAVHHQKLYKDPTWATILYYYDVCEFCIFFCEALAVSSMPCSSQVWFLGLAANWAASLQKNLGCLFPSQWVVLWAGSCLFDLFYFHSCSDQTSVLFRGINLWCLVSVRCCKLMESKDRREKYWSDIAACVCTEVSELKRQESQRGSEGGIKMKNVMWLSLWCRELQNKTTKGWLPP